MKIIFFYIIVVCFVACKDTVAKKEKILRDFDNVNNALNRIDTSLNPVDKKYDSVLQAAWKNEKTQQLYYTLTDFHGYLYDLRDRLNNYAQGAGDSVELTNIFFKDRKKGLYAYLNDVTEKLQLHTNDTAILGRIEKFKSETTEDRINIFFTNVPPVAVITILNSFEHSIRNIEFDVLTDQLKKQ